MSNTVWALNCYHNDYNQHGPTLVAVWLEEPVVEQVCNMLPRIIDTSGIATIEQLNTWLRKNEARFNFAEWSVVEIPVGVRL